MGARTVKTHEEGMKLALLQARKALAIEEVPIGAVIVDARGTVVSVAYNQMEKKQSQLGHAEALAIAKASRKLSSWRLNGCWIYVTLEPCLMCLGLIQLSRLSGICFGASSKLFGTGLDAGKAAPFYLKSLDVEAGVKKTECLEMLQQFFKAARKKRKDAREAKRGSAQ